MTRLPKGVGATCQSMSSYVKRPNSFRFSDSMVPVLGCYKRPLAFRSRTCSNLFVKKMSSTLVLHDFIVSCGPSLCVQTTLACPPTSSWNSLLGCEWVIERVMWFSIYLHWKTTRFRATGHNSLRWCLAASFGGLPLQITTINVHLSLTLCMTRSD